MVEPTVKQEIISVVLLGDFNPAIFHPQWLVHNELISSGIAEAAKEVSCQSEFSTFEVDNMKLFVEKERFGLTTKDVSMLPVFRDTVKGIFTLLEHTPLKALGLNYDFRYSMPDDESWHRLGHTLAPKECCWDSLLEKPGMAALAIRGSRGEVPESRVDIRVNPIWDEKNGVFIGINQHYRFDDLEDTAIVERNQRVLNILETDWQSFCEYAKNAVKKILKTGDKTET